MSFVDVLNINAEKVAEVELNDSIFNVEVESYLLHEVIRMQLVARRTGSASIKRRSDVSGSTRKLMRQKGTGNARRGDIKSPLLRGGGVIFGPNTKNYSYTIPKKKRKLALRMALSNKFQENRILVLDKFSMDSIKTKEFISILNKLNEKNVLIIADKKDIKIELSSRNVPKVKVLRVSGLNVYDLLKHNALILLKDSLASIEEKLCI